MRTQYESPNRTLDGCGVAILYMERAGREKAWDFADTPSFPAQPNGGIVQADNMKGAAKYAARGSGHGSGKKAAPFNMVGGVLRSSTRGPPVMMMIAIFNRYLPSRVVHRRLECIVE